MKYNDIISEEVTITTGVPQGSIMGPLLCRLNMNDIQNYSKTVSSILFSEAQIFFIVFLIYVRELNFIMQNEAK